MPLVGQSIQFSLFRGLTTSSFKFFIFGSWRSFSASCSVSTFTTTVADLVFLTPLTLMPDFPVSTSFISLSFTCWLVCFESLSRGLMITVFLFFPGRRLADVDLSHLPQSPWSGFGEVMALALLHGCLRSFSYASTCPL